MRTFARYLIITGLSFVTNVGVTLLLTEALNLYEEASFAIALVTVFIMNFLFMRYYIYTDHEGSARRQFIMYTLSAIGFRGIEYISFLLIHTWLGVQYTVAIILILANSSIAKFFYFKVVVFTGKGSRVEIFDDATKGTSGNR